MGNHVSWVHYTHSLRLATLRPIVHLPFPKIRYIPMSTSSSTSLIPVRVDVSSSDKTTRIIETLLIDPTCWPIPLYYSNHPSLTMTSSSVSAAVTQQQLLLHESVERNIKEYAHSILSDAEVHGMGRTVRHFTGRIDTIWTPSLQTLVEDQLRPQLWAIALSTVPATATTATATTTRRTEGSTQHPHHHPSSSSSLIPISIRLLLPNITTTTVTTPSNTNNTTNNNNANNNSSSTTNNTTSSIGIVVHEDFLWDPSLTSSAATTTTTTAASTPSPLEFAQDMTRDLQLPEEAAIDIATTLLEQLHGLDVPPLGASAAAGGVGGGTDPSSRMPPLDGSSTLLVETSMRGAWKMDPKEYVATTTQIISSHRPL